MSILSRIGGAIKSVASKIGGLLSGNNPASAGMSFPLLPGVGLNGPNQSIAPNMTVAPTATDPGGPGVMSNGTAVSINNPAYTASRGSYISAAPTNSPTILNSSVSSGSRIAADSLSTSGSSGPLTTLTGLPSAGGVTPSTTGVAAPSAPSTGTNHPIPPKYTDPGKVNLAGTASTLTGMYALNPDTGQLEPVTEDKLAAERKKTAMDIMSRIPQKDNVYEDPQVRAQQAEVDARKQEVQNHTAELNAIVAKQNADLLQLENVGSKEGVTEAVYGGQSAEINREAAIKALPVQAQVAAAQGNLQLAQEHLTDLTKIISENLDNAYNYKKAQFEWAAQYATGEDKIKLENLRKATDVAIAAKKDNINFAQQMVLKYGDQPQVVNAVSGLLKNPDSPTLGQDLIKVAGTAEGSASNSSGFIDIIQQAIDAGATPEQAAREAATTSENSGIPVDQKTLNQWVSQAKTLKKTTAETSPSNSATTSTLSPREAAMEADIANYKSQLPPNIKDVNYQTTAYLRQRGYTNQEIIDSSVGGTVDKLVTGISKYLFGQ